MREPVGSRVLPPQLPEFPSRCRCPKTTGVVPIFRRRAISHEAKRRRRMLAGAETQAGIKDDDGLIFSRTRFAPARLDQQRAADFDGLEMPFPRFRPVFAADFCDRRFCRDRFSIRNF